MYLLQLTYFRELARREHLLRTAETFHVSPSTISANLKSLEDELGVPLFDRVGRNLKRNKQGDIFLSYVDMVFQNLEDGKRAITNSVIKDSKSFAFSLKDMAYYNELFPMVWKQFPGLSIRHYEGDPDDMGNLLWEKDLDLMITAKDLSVNPKLQSEIIYIDPYVLAVSPQHRLADRRRCSLKDLEEETILNRPRDNYFQRSLEGILEEEAFHSQKAMEFDYVSRPFMVRSNLGVCFTTELTMELALYQGLSKVYVEELMEKSYIIKAYWRKAIPLAPPARALISAMSEGTKAIILSLKEKK